MSRASIVPALVAAIVVLALGAGAASLFVWYLLPRQGQTAVGVRIDGAPVPDGMSAHDYVRERARQFSSRPVTFRLPRGRAEDVTLSDLGVWVDLESTMRRAMNVGREGTLFYRLARCWQARGGRINIPIAWRIDANPVLDRVHAEKEAFDDYGRPARYDFKAKAVKSHEDGKYLNSYAMVDALDRLVRAGGNTLEAIVTAVPPVVTDSFLKGIDISQRVGHFETRFGYRGRQANRAHNIATAAERLDGIVMLSQQILSFNKIVGHRTLDNGFREGWEIFRGEMVEGVGGGTCQVASTLHAAAYLGGMDVIERSPHSRPSGYVPMGLDATVVDGLVDLKLRNPFDFPVLVHSFVNEGQIVFELLGKQRPVRVTFRADVVDTQRYNRKVRVTPWLEEGRVVRKQRGILGYTVRRTRTLRRDGRSWDEVTTDYYPPTVEIYLVSPGTDPEEDLPPLPFEESEPEAGSEPDDGAPDSDDGGACEGDCEVRERPIVEDAPEARQSPPRPSHRVVIER